MTDLKLSGSSLMSSGLQHVLPSVELKGTAPDGPTVDGIEASHTGFTLGDFCIDEYRPIKVIAIGAGFSGIAAAVRLPQRVTNLDLVVYDQNETVGGTWSSSKYPGLCCDIPSHCYQYTFEENTEWSAFYAPGEEIRSYLQRVVDKYKCMRYIKLNHRVVHAEWHDETCKWKLRIQNLKPDNQSIPETFEDDADVVIAGMGGLSRWSWPSIRGLHTFKGKLMHSAEWTSYGEDPETQGHYNEAGKRIAVIGVGSSAIQLVPALQPRAKQVVNFVRGKTWIATPFASDKIKELMARQPGSENYQFTDEDRDRFRDPQYYKEFRQELESELNSVHPATLKHSAMQQGAREAFKAMMEKKLAKKPWIADHLIPTFPVACRRLTPGPGYLESLCEDNVDFVANHIKCINKKGIETEDGRQFDFDMIVCATGYDTSGDYRFPIIGENGITLADKHKPYPIHYLTVAVDGFPNWWNSLGAGSAIGSGSLLVMVEWQIEYAAKAILKMQRERIKKMVVKREAAEDFDRFIGSYFPMTVYSEKCRSWYKVGGKEDGRVRGLWPGSCLHCLRALEHPRWEDYDYVRLHDNRFHWLGNGQTLNEKTMTGDRAWYLRPEYVNRPTVPK